MSRNKKNAPEAEAKDAEVKEEKEKNTEPKAENTEEPVEELVEEAADAADELAQKVADLTDRLQRSMAEFDNYRKRTEKEKAARYDMGARSVIEKVLPILDNFERGLATVDAANKDPFAEGMDKVYKQMVAMLDEIGVEPIEAVGQKFDPNFHNAVMHVEDEEAGENVIVEEFQRGYTYKDSVVRYSMVKVAN